MEGRLASATTGLEGAGETGSSALRPGEGEGRARARRAPDRGWRCGAARSAAAWGACAPREGLPGGECQPTRPPAGGSQGEPASCRGSTRLLRELFSWTYSIPGASPLSFHGVGCVGTVAGMPGSPATSLVPCRVLRGVAGEPHGGRAALSGAPLPGPTRTGPRFPGSLPAEVGPAASDACGAPVVG